MSEIWKIVSACPAYEVSSEGKVRRRLPGKRTRRGREVRAFAKGKYLNVMLVMDGVRRQFRVNRLVCEAFHGPAPSLEHEAAHENGQHLDNRAVNLEWKTPKGNKADELLHGTRTRGERHGLAKLSEGDVRRIRGMHGTALNCEIARRFGISPSSVTDILKKRTWGWLQP